jgi:membrane-bound lytic murein transglycosylase C
MFNGIKYPKSKIYCAISAYNTGAGNVAKTFTGKRSVKQTMPQINAACSLPLNTQKGIGPD